MVTAKSKQSLKNMILAGEDEIRVEDPILAKWIVIIHGIKQLSWAAAIILIAAGIYSMLATGGAAAPAAFAAESAAVGVVGFSGASAMLGLGVALGGITGLKTIRNKYKIVEKGHGYVVLQKPNRR